MFSDDPMSERNDTLVARARNEPIVNYGLCGAQR